MSLKPIDLQSNISHMHEVAKSQQARNEAVTQQQYLRDNESAEQSKLVDSKVGENKKGEKSGIQKKNDSRSGGKYSSESGQKDQKDDENNTSNENKFVEDLKLGRIIDIKK